MCVSCVRPVCAMQDGPFEMWPESRPREANNIYILSNSNAIEFAGWLANIINESKSTTTRVFDWCANGACVASRITFSHNTDTSAIRVYSFIRSIFFVLQSSTFDSLAAADRYIWPAVSHLLQVQTVLAMTMNELNAENLWRRKYIFPAVTLRRTTHS